MNSSFKRKKEKPNRDRHRNYQIKILDSTLEEIKDMPKNTVGQKTLKKSKIKFLEMKNTINEI